MTTGGNNDGQAPRSKTLLRPQPGGRGPARPSASVTGFVSGAWAEAAASSGSPTPAVEEFVTRGENPLIAAAGPLLLLGATVGSLVSQADVEGLRAEAAARGRDHVGREAEPGGDVDAGGGSGDALAQLIGGGEGLLVEAHGGVDDSLGVLGIDLERGVVRGDDGPAALVQEVLGDGDGQGRALFGIGGGAEFIQKNERCRVGAGSDAVEVHNMG